MATTTRPQNTQHNPRHYPSTQQLRYLVALDDTRHFGQAAARCFVSQSAFSIAIKALETLLDAHLVDRTNRSVTITPLGQDVVTQARLVLRDIDMLIDMAGAQHAPLCGKLHLGVIPTIAPFLIPRLLPALRKAYPQLELYLKEDQTQNLYDALLKGELDVILMAFPYPLSKVKTQILFQDHFRLAAHKNTRHINPERIAFNRLNRDSLLLLEDGHCMRDHALNACKVRNLDSVNHFSATSLTTLVQMVDNDLGVTFLPDMAKGSGLLKHTKVKTYPLPDKAYREIGLAWRAGSGRDSEFALLGEFIRQHHSGT